MTKYIFYWRNNSRPTVSEGATVAKAFTAAGYSAGALPAVDYYAEVKKDDPDYNLPDQELAKKKAIETVSPNS